MTLIPQRFRKAAAYICPFAAILVMNSYLLWPRELSHSVLLPAAAVLLGWLGSLYVREEDRRLRRYAIVFGFMLMIAQVCGARLDAAGSIADSGQTALSLLMMLVSSLLLAPSGAGLLVALIRWLKSMQDRAAQPRKWSERKVFWVCFGLILLSWVPVLLAYWPGIISYDVARQVSQVLSGSYNDHNPIAHTLLIGGFVAAGRAIGSPNAGFAAYSIFQMAVTAFVMAYILRFLWRIKCPRWFCVCLLLLCCFAPFHQMLSISTTKDILFADALAAWAVLMAEGLLEPERRKKASWNIGWVFSAMAASLMRTNGIAAIAAVLIGGFFLLRKNRALCKRVLCLTLAALIGYFGIHTALVEGLNAAPGPFHETLSVPIQQISRLLKVNPWIEERYEAYHWIPDLDLYQPALSDYPKHSTDIQPSDLPEFLSLWAKLGIRYPVVYLDAFGFLTKGYWQLDDMSHATFRGELPEYHEGYLGTIFRECGGATPDSQWPAAYDWYESMYTVNGYLNIPFLSVITGLAFWCWLMLALLFASLYLRRKDTLLPLIMGTFLYVMLYLGPCCIIRYVYPFIFIVPVCMGVLIAPFQKEKAAGIEKS